MSISHELIQVAELKKMQLLGQRSCCAAFWKKHWQRRILLICNIHFERRDCVTGQEKGLCDRTGFRSQKSRLQKHKIAAIQFYT